jgi:hypothetical protein
MEEYPMKLQFPALLVPAVILAACSPGADVPSPDARDLSLAAVPAQETAPVLSSLERGTRSDPRAPTRRAVKRAPVGVETEVAAPEGTVEAPVPGTDPTPEPVAVAFGAVTEAAPTEEPASGGLGTPLGAGETVTIIPAIAGDGSGGGGRGQGSVGIGRHGGGTMLGGHDDCAPSRGGVIAVNQPFVGRPSRYRRH